mmetsp:Transcript_694/g.1271  ORF Transcript_694/g.1271 Transcript_694/m.1271 type:complete len:97 (+) Transcript_694:416-706(+)
MGLSAIQTLMASRVQYFQWHIALGFSWTWVKKWQHSPRILCTSFAQAGERQSFIFQQVFQQVNATASSSRMQQRSPVSFRIKSDVSMSCISHAAHS